MFIIKPTVKNIEIKGITECFIDRHIKPSLHTVYSNTVVIWSLCMIWKIWLRGTYKEFYWILVLNFVMTFTTIQFIWRSTYGNQVGGNPEWDLLQNPVPKRLKGKKCQIICQFLMMVTMTMITCRLNFVFWKRKFDFCLKFFYSLVMMMTMITCRCGSTRESDWQLYLCERNCSSSFLLKRGSCWLPPSWCIREQLT